MSRSGDRHRSISNAGRASGRDRPRDAGAQNGVGAVGRSREAPSASSRSAVHCLDGSSVAGHIAHAISTASASAQHTLHATTARTSIPLRLRNAMRVRHRNPRGLSSSRPIDIEPSDSSMTLTSATRDVKHRARVVGCLKRPGCGCHTVHRYNEHA